MTVPVFNLTDTWNSGATVFTAIKMNVTNTASAAGSLLMDLQVAGSSLFSVDSNGEFKQSNASGGFVSSLGTLTTFNTSAPGIFMSSGGVYSWSNDLFGGSAAPFTQLSRDSSGIIAQRNSTNAQTLRVYNTFTDASNYERGVFDWQVTSNVFRVGTEKAGTGSTRNILFQIGGTNKLDYGVTTAAYWTTPDDFKARLLQTQGFTVATLPAAGTAGRMAYVTDALAPSFLSTVVGGGSIVAPVFDNGTNWVGA